jgi:hypothetical protein
VCEDGDDAGNGARGGGVDRGDARVCVRARDDAQHERAGRGVIGGQVERERLAALHDAARGLGAGGGADALRGRRGRRRRRGIGSRPRLAHLAEHRRADGLADGAVARAAAEVAFHAAVEVIEIIAAQRRGGHGHAGRAESALEAEAVGDRLLHGMQLIGGREARGGRDGVALDAHGGDQA